MLNVGILTSGGDCQALNAAMRGVVLSLFEKTQEIKIFGFEDGFKGLIYKKYRQLFQEDFETILDEGGTILGSSREPFKHITEITSEGIDKVQSMIETYKDLKLDCLVILGGNGTHKTANLLSEKGLNIVTLPKTIDNDIYGTDMTFGFQTAVGIATKIIRYIQSTAKSHSRIFIVEVMGHKTGWLTLHAGIASGADVILLPEIPYNIEKITERLKSNEANGKKYAIIAVAEGAYSSEFAELSKKERKLKLSQTGFPSAAYRVASELQAAMPEKETRVQIIGHCQRGGEPCAYDKVLASRVGTAAASYILEKKFGVMAGITNGKIVPVPLNEVAGKLKKISSDDQLVQQAKSLGICIGI